MKFSFAIYYLNLVRILAVNDFLLIYEVNIVSSNLPNVTSTIGKIPLSRGLRKKAGTDDQVPALIEFELSSNEFRQNYLNDQIRIKKSVLAIKPALLTGIDMDSV